MRKRQRKPRMDVNRRIAEYLNGPAFTLWTFIKKSERSGDPAHCRRVRDNMRRRLNDMMKQGAAHRARSIRGKVAFRKGLP